MVNISNLNWQNLYSYKNIPKKVLFWIEDSKSLTQKLKNKYSDFYLEITLQGDSEIYSHEISKLEKNRQYIVREVILYGNKIPVVFARSIIPKTIHNSLKLEVGDKPLGEILFNDSKIKRSPIEVTFYEEIWGRRSVFIMNNERILVSEFFFEELYA